MCLAAEAATVRQFGQVGEISSVVERIQRAAYERIAEIQTIHTAKWIAQILQISRSCLQFLKTSVTCQRIQGEKVGPEHRRKTSLQVLG